MSVFLTVRARRVHEMRQQGATYEEIALDLGTTPKRAKEIEWQVRRRLRYEATRPDERCPHCDGVLA